MEFAVTINNKCSSQLCVEGSENELILERHLWKKKWPGLKTSPKLLFSLCLGVGQGNFFLQAAILVYSSCSSLEVLIRGHGFPHVLENNEENWSSSIQLFLPGCVPQGRTGNITECWEGGSGRLQSGEIAASM